MSEMGSWGGKLLRSIVVLPLTVGNYRDRQNGSGYYDCTISSRVLFLVVLAIVIVFTASKDITIHSELRLGFVLILLSALMVSAAVGFGILGCLVRKYGVKYTVTGARNANTPKLQVVFLWVFGLASVFYCSFFVSKQIECFGQGSDVAFWHILLYFNIILILSLLSQMIVISYFSPYELKQIFLVNFAMPMLLFANVCIFVYGTLISNTFLYIIEMYPNNTIANCLETNSTISALLQKSNTILKPCFTEFCLLSCTILLEIWSPTNEVQNPDEETAVKEISDIQSSESSPLLPTSPTTAGHPPSRNEDKRTACQLITLILSLTVGLGLFICYVIMAMGTENIYIVRYVAEIYELVLKALMVLAISIGFYCLVNYCTPEPSKGFKPWEYVYLMSAFGVLMMHVFESIGGDVSSDFTAKPFMITSILSIFQTYLQVVFLLHANRCKKGEGQSHIHLLESALIFIMICNFIFWLNDSFLIAEFSTTRILENVSFSEELLSLVYNILLPVSIFFRFTSFLEYYATFGKYNK